MYRIKLSSGQELAYESNDAFAAAVRSGQIGSDAEIYHARTDRWLSVTMHPQYQRALQSAPSAPAAEPAAVPGRVTRRRLRLTRPAPSASVPPAASSAPASQAPAAPAPAAAPAGELDFVQLEPQFEVAPSSPAESASTESAPTEPAPAEPEEVEPGEAVEAVEAVEPDEPRERSIEDLKFIDLGPTDGRDDSWGGVSRRSSELKFIEVEPAPPTSGPAIPPPIVPPPVSTPLVAPRPLDPTIFGPGPQASAPVTPEPKRPAAVVEPARSAAAPEPIAPPPPAPAPPMAVEPIAPAEPSLSLGAREPDMLAAPSEVRSDSAWSEPVDWSEPAAPIASITTPVASITTRKRSSRRGVVTAGIAGLIVMVGGLIAWQPWRSEPELRSSTAAARAGSPIVSDEDTAQPAAPAGGTGFMQVRTSAQLPYRPSSGQGDSVVQPPAVSPPSLDVPASASVALPSTIEHRGTLPISPTELASHYADAYASAQATLRNQITAAGFSRLLLPVRLADAPSVARANRAISAASEAVSAYRDREAMIEQAYQDTLAMVGQQLGLGADELKAWDTRRLQRESAATVNLTSSYLQELGALFGLLAENEGAYHLAGDSIRFDRPEAAQAYNSARTWLMQHAESSDSASPTVRQMLRAMDGAELPGVGR